MPPAARAKREKLCPHSHGLTPEATPYRPIRLRSGQALRAKQKFFTFYSTKGTSCNVRTEYYFLFGMGLTRKGNEA